MKLNTRVQFNSISIQPIDFPHLTATQSLLTILPFLNMGISQRHQLSIHFLQIQLPFWPIILKFVSYYSVHSFTLCSFISLWGFSENRRCNLIWNPCLKLLPGPLDPLSALQCCTHLILARPNIKLKFKLTINENTGYLLYSYFSPILHFWDPIHYTLNINLLIIIHWLSLIIMIAWSDYFSIFHVS